MICVFVCFVISIRPQNIDKVLKYSKNPFQKFGRYYEYKSRKSCSKIPQKKSY